MTRIYMDACCLNRLTDDQSQSRIRQEAEAVEAILRLVRQGKAVWISSGVLELEINRNPDEERRRDVAALLAFANETLVPGPVAVERAIVLQSHGLAAFDALHLAMAEQAHADVFLTTDDHVRRRAARHADELGVRVENPVFWYQQVAG